MDGWRSPLLPLEKGRSVGPSDGVYKMRRLSFPNPLIWIFFDPAVAAACTSALLCSSSSSFFLPLVLGDIYLLKEVVTKDVARNFTAAAYDGDDDESNTRNATSRSSWTLWILSCLISYFQVIVLDLKVYDLPRVLADD